MLAATYREHPKISNRYILNRQNQEQNYLHGHICPPTPFQPRVSVFTSSLSLRRNPGVIFGSCRGKASVCVNQDVLTDHEVRITLDVVSARCKYTQLV